MKVKLIEHTPNPEKLISMAAKLCYSSSTIDDIGEGLTDEKIKSFLNMLMDIGHESPLEHVSFTFAIEGISRSCSHQLVRHRIASYSQKSQRYVDETQFGYVIPESIKNNTVACDVYETLMSAIQLEYDAIREALIKDFMEQGMTQKAAEKKANEDARFVLPNACETSIIVTMNIRSLFNFFKHRCCNRAQWEIREMATLMYAECLKVCPNIFKHAGPSCYTTGRCPEGKMSCGKINEIKNKFDELNKIENMTNEILTIKENDIPTVKEKDPPETLETVVCVNGNSEDYVYAKLTLSGELTHIGDPLLFANAYPIKYFDRDNYAAKDIMGRKFKLIVRVDVKNLPPTIDEK
jgi:thymidylate synthase (FAD)